MRKKIILYSLLTFSVIAFVFVYFCNKTIMQVSKGKLYSRPDVIPFNKVGLLLGTSKYLVDGRPNLYYLFRIQAAVELYKHGKIKYIIVSGDNGTTDYNEPEDMRNDLIAQGVDLPTLLSSG